MSRNDVLGKAANDCMKELYSLVQPSIEWDEFVKENEIYSDKYKVWERFNYLSRKEDKTENELEEYSKYLEWENKSREECIGPRPFEFYYLPQKILKEICDSYVYAYKIDSHKELLNTIEILKNYCKEPIEDKWIEEHTDENGFRHPGYRGYEHPNNLQVCLIDLITDSNLNLENNTNVENLAESLQNKFFEFLDKAGKFFDWNRDLNCFNMSVYLGPSPNSNKEAVIKNWKEYRGQDIEIDETKYDEEDDDYDI